MSKLSISDLPDGSGYYYGRYTLDDGRFVVVNLRPPSLFLSKWVVYIEGDEVAQLDRRGDVLPAVTKACDDYLKDNGNV